MRLTVCLEGNTEGRVLASVDMEEIVKMTITDDIEKSNFNPQMLKNCTDISYECGYQQGRADAINEMKDKLQLSAIYTETEEGWSGMTVDTIQIEEIANELKERKQ